MRREAMGQGSFVLIPKGKWDRDKELPRLIQDYPHLKQFKSDCPVAQKVVSEVLSLPVHAGVSSEEAHEIGELVRNWANQG